MKRIQLMGPVFFRLILIIVLGLACAGLTNPYWGMGVVILGFFAEILMHLNYIARLAHWLDDSVSVTRADAAEVPMPQWAFGPTFLRGFIKPAGPLIKTHDAWKSVKRATKKRSERFRKASFF